MERIIVWSFGEDFIENLAEFIVKNFSSRGVDLSKVACVFGGKRPALFLRRELARKIKKPFYPPQAFSIDEFLEYIVSSSSPSPKISGLDASFFVYNLAKELAPGILEGRDSFSEFLPWAQEIVTFIEQLDLEDIQDESLGHISKSAAIGYDVPSNINLLLEHIIKIRSAYHAILSQKRIFSRGLIYLRASQLIDKKTFNEFDAIIFCNFFYLHATELRIIKEVYKQGKGICIFQGDRRQWSVLEKNAHSFAFPAQPPKPLTPEPSVFFYAGFDMHSQVCLTRQILSKTKRLDSTVIVLPQAKAMVPLLCEISSQVTDFNVSLGYPLGVSSLSVLFKALFRAQESRIDDAYYAKDYLGLLRHPLVKNIKFSSSSAITRVLVHKMEEVLTGKQKSELGGTLFVNLSSIEQSQEIYSSTRDTLEAMDIKVNLRELAQILKCLHRIFFHSWQLAKNFSEFAVSLGELVVLLVDKSPLTAFAFNLKAIERIYSVKEEFQSSSLRKESFSSQEMGKIFLQKLEGETVPFVGTPLKGLQILGLLETRSLNFENVIVMDVNESIMPKLKIYEPLIPREVMLSLGLNRLEKEEEIQRYQFMRLISGAKNVHLIYEENQEKSKSRFIEELLWRKQKQSNKLEVIPVAKGAFNLKITQGKVSIKKTKEMIVFLKKEIYSPSRINTYLNCPWQFYYQYILGFAAQDDLLTEPQARHIGTFIHELIEEGFKKFLNKKPVIDKKFRKEFNSLFEDKFAQTIAKRMKSDSFLLKGIIQNRLKQFLDKETLREPAKIICLEEKFQGQIKLNGEVISFISKVDRIDQCSDGSISIIDYKTGGVGSIPKRLAQLEKMEFSRSSIKDNIKSFQLPLYYYLTRERFSGVCLNAELYSVRTLERKPFISQSDYLHKERIMEICLKALEFIFGELFDPNIPFEPDRQDRHCESCGFRCFC